MNGRHVIAKRRAARCCEVTEETGDDQNPILLNIGVAGAPRKSRPKMRRGSRGQRRVCPRALHLHSWTAPGLGTPELGQSDGLILRRDDGAGTAGYGQKKTLYLKGAVVSTRFVGVFTNSSSRGNCTPAQRSRVVGYQLQPQIHASKTWLSRRVVLQQCASGSCNADVSESAEDEVQSVEPVSCGRHAVEMDMARACLFQLQRR
jgi:hypothetical protein